MPQTQPYGTWESPITADELCRKIVGFGCVQVVDDALYWLESNPDNHNHQVLYRRTADGVTEQLVPNDFNIGSRVHEYGSGACWMHHNTIFAVKRSDQRIYRFNAPNQDLMPITPEPTTPGGFRYADGVVMPDGLRMYCVREYHNGQQYPANELVMIPTDGRQVPQIVFGDSDFVSSPCISPDGTRLAWVSWDFPHMPWDSTRLHVATIQGDGTLCDVTIIAGGKDISVSQPRWNHQGVLHFISDESGWWNIYACKDNEVKSLTPMAAEFCGPPWGFGMKTYDFFAEGAMACCYEQAGVSTLAILKPNGTELKALPCELTAIGSVQVMGDQHLIVTGASPTQLTKLIRMKVDGTQTKTLKQITALSLSDSMMSIGEPIQFPTTDNAIAHAYFYPPKHTDYTAPDHERPPLVVCSHGGPTAHCGNTYSLAIQYWTSRGIAVVDVNYRGSSGYGRHYRQALYGYWGVRDVEDCIAAVTALAETDRIDPQRVAIRGGSAGGYTTLCGLTFHDTFAAGASYFGVSDVAALAADTHKFESHYIDQLIGTDLNAKDHAYHRSPIHFTDQITTPVILFQGTEDKVVPPNQAEKMAMALKNKNIPHALFLFDGEPHGFIQPKNNITALESELSFYGQVFHFKPHGIKPITLS